MTPRIEPPAQRRQCAGVDFFMQGRAETQGDLDRAFAVDASVDREPQAARPVWRSSAGLPPGRLEAAERGRNRCINKIKQWLATRYVKAATIHLAGLHLAGLDLAGLDLAAVFICPERRSEEGGLVLRCQGAQDVEIVVLGVSHDHPVPVWALAHVHLGGAETQQSGHLVLGAAIDRADVEVKPVLDGLALGHMDEHEGGWHLAGPDILDGRHPGADLDLALAPVDHPSRPTPSPVSSRW